MNRMKQISPSGGPPSQRVFFEQAWGDHEPDLHPDTLKLHVERRQRDAHVSLVALSAFLVNTLEAAGHLI